jgi:hypothetical protein
MRRGRRAVVAKEKGRQAPALLAPAQGRFACPVRCLSGRMATSTIDLGSEKLTE